jgi:hypothetical protein
MFLFGLGSISLAVAGSQGPRIGNPIFLLWFRFVHGMKLPDFVVFVFRYGPTGSKGRTWLPLSVILTRSRKGLLPDPSIFLIDYQVAKMMPSCLLRVFAENVFFIGAVYFFLMKWRCDAVPGTGTLCQSGTPPNYVLSSPFHPLTECKWSRPLYIYKQYRVFSRDNSVAFTLVKCVPLPLSRKS